LIIDGGVTNDTTNNSHGNITTSSTFNQNIISTLTETGSITDNTNLVGPRDIQVYGDYAYVACKDGPSLTVLNVSDPIFTTYIGQSDLIVGQQYMILEGAIQHPVGLGNPIYGPGLVNNVFTATTNSYDLTSGSNPTPKVIRYYPYELLAWTPDRVLGNIEFIEYGVGNVICGGKAYFYRLTTSDGSYTSPWSYGSSIVPVGTENESAFGGALVGGGTQTVTRNSNKSVKIKISNIDSARYGLIEMACVEYDQLVDVPRQITIVSRQDITLKK